MIDNIISTLKDKMSKTIDILKSNLSSVKVGRANPSMLDRIEVEYYGSMTEKAILKSDLGLVPNNDGSTIRLIIPEMTEETRKDTVKKVKKIAEDSKVSIRAIRRDANDKAKSLKKENSITEDELKKSEDEIQKITDKFIKDIVSVKEKEIMSI